MPPIDPRAAPRAALPWQMLRSLLVLLSLLTLPVAVSASAAQPAATPPAAFSPVDCAQVFPQGVGDETITCGYLSAPQLHSQPDGPALELAVVILRATGPDPAPDALFLNQGGPGFSSIDIYAAMMRDSRLRTGRDLVIFDQRGTGHSRPALDCPEIFELDIDLLDEVLPAEELNARYNEAALRCRDRLARQGVNLAAYNSLENAHDVDALRQALGYPQIDLYGVSYGALLTLHTLRQHPAGLRSVILDSVMPPQRNLFTDPPLSADQAFTRFFQDCAASQSCTAAHPDLEDRFFSLVHRFNEQPAELELIDPQTGTVYSAKMSGDNFLWTVFQALYASDLVPLLPEVIRTAEAGDFTPLEAIYSVLVFDRGGMLGMYWSVNCAEDGSFDLASVDYSAIRPEVAKDQEAGLVAVQRLCQAWGSSPLDPTVNAPVSSAVPALIFSGRYDPITPLSYARETAASLSRSQVVVFADVGHGVLGSSECGESLLAAFLEDPARPLDSGCAAAIPPLEFKDSRDYVAFPFIALLQSLLSFRLVVWAGLLALLPAWILLLSSLVLYPLAWLVSLFRRSRDLVPEERSAPPIAALTPAFSILAALCSLALVAGLAVILVRAVTANDAILLFGLPDQTRLVLWLAPAIAILTLLMLLGTLYGLFDPGWSLWRKIYQLLVSLAALVLSGTMAAAGWMIAWF